MTKILSGKFAPIGVGDFVYYMENDFTKFDIGICKRNKKYKGHPYEYPYLIYMINSKKTYNLILGIYDKKLYY
jgi:hypothetical protein